MKIDFFLRRLVFVFACGALAATAAEKIPGRSSFGEKNGVEYLSGDLPVVLTAPHGGRLRPDAIPSRATGVTEMDANTPERARALAAELLARGASFTRRSRARSTPPRAARASRKSPPRCSRFSSRKTTASSATR